MKATPRQRAFAGAGAIAAIVAVVAAAPAGGATDSPEPDIVVPEQFAGVVENAGGRSLVVNANGRTALEFDEATAFAFALDDVVVTVEGIDVAPPHQRRAADAAQARRDNARGLRAGTSPTCPETVPGPRSIDGSTAPVLPCNPVVTRRAEVLTALAGAPEDSLASAVDSVLLATFPGLSLPPSTVVREGGYFRVDMPAAAGAAVRDLPQFDALLVDQALVLTASTNGEVDAVQFTIEGDCLKWAHAVKGDQCATIPVPIPAN